MSTPHWDRIKAVFQEAADLKGGARGTFLDQACAGDPVLRAEVEKLLGHADGTETIDIFANRSKSGLTPGELITGRFRIQRFVGKGGMGEVYEAADEELGGSVALKTLRPELNEDAEFLTRFRREVQLARQVTHPNICRVFDVGRAPRDGADLTFLTMEFLDGETLAQHLRRRERLSTAEALPLIRQMAAGLDALHQQGIIHRDFKPGNVLVVESTGGATRAVISDFGLARALENGATSISRSGHVLGTPDYMAPEQLLGETVTPAADIYALGLVMYEMVTGKKAFPGGRPLENAVQRVVEKPSPPKEHSAEISAGWNAVILRCLARDPADRPASAGAVVAALEGTPLPARRSTARPWLIAAGIILALVATLLAGMRLGVWTGGDGSGKAGDQQVALLPFNVAGEQPELRVFALGLMETITSRLTQFENGQQALMVVPASEVRSQQAKTARDALQKFKATTAVEGSLQGDGEKIRLTMVLIDTARMRQVETITIEDSRGNPLRLEDAAVTRLANALNVRLQGKYAKEQQETMPIAPGAYEFYLQARGYLQRRDQAQSLASAETLLKRALESDPKFALAHSALGETYVSQYLITRDPKLMDQALKRGSEGLALNPNAPETSISMGRIRMATGGYAEAKRDFERAIELDSRNNVAHIGLGDAYAELKDYDRAEATYRKAVSLRPGDWTAYHAAGLFHYSRNEFDKAIEAWTRVVQLTPDNSQGYSNLGGGFARKGDWAAAQRYWEKALELDPANAATLGNLGKAYYERGDFAKSVETYQRAINAGSRSFRSWGQLGGAHARLGQASLANQAFAKATQILEANILVDSKSALYYSSLAFYRARLQRRDYAEPLARSLQLAGADPDILARNAEAHAIAGDREQALTLMRRALAAGAAPEIMRRSEHLKDLVSVARATQ